MNKYLLEIDSFIPAMYLKDWKAVAHYNLMEVDDINIFVSFTLNPDEAKKFSNEKFANDFCKKINEFQPLQFSPISVKVAMEILHPMQEVKHLSKSLSEDDIKQKNENDEKQNILKVLDCENCEHNKEYRNSEVCMSCQDKHKLKQYPRLPNIETEFIGHIDLSEIQEGYDNGNRMDGYGDDFESQKKPLALEIAYHKYKLKGDDWVTFWKGDGYDVRKKQKDWKDIKVCKECLSFGNPDQCPAKDPDHVSCPAAKPIEKDEVEKNCGNCKSVLLHYNEGPCKICTGDNLSRSQWEPKEKSNISPGVVDTDAANRQVD